MTVAPEGSASRRAAAPEPLALLRAQPEARLFYVRLQNLDARLHVRDARAQQVEHRPAQQRRQARGGRHAALGAHHHIHLRWRYQLSQRRSRLQHCLAARRCSQHTTKAGSSGLCWSARGARASALKHNTRTATSGQANSPPGAQQSCCCVPQPLQGAGPSKEVIFRAQMRGFPQDRWRRLRLLQGQMQASSARISAASMQRYIQTLALTLGVEQKALGFALSVPSRQMGVPPSSRRRRCGTAAPARASPHSLHKAHAVDKGLAQKNMCSQARLRGEASQRAASAHCSTPTQPKGPDVVAKEALSAAPSAWTGANPST